MLNDETRRKLRVLNIGEFIEELEIQQQDPQTLALPFDDRFQLLTDSVYQRKYNEKVRRLIKNAKFRLPKADIHDILYIDKLPLSRGIIADLASCRFVDDCRSIVFQGYPSSGKTFLGCAMAIFYWGLSVYPVLAYLRYLREIVDGRTHAFTGELTEIAQDSVREGVRCKTLFFTDDAGDDQRLCYYDLNKYPQEGCSVNRRYTVTVHGQSIVAIQPE